MVRLILFLLLSIFFSNVGVRAQRLNTSNSGYTEKEQDSTSVNSRPGFRKQSGVIQRTDRKRVLKPLHSSQLNLEVDADTDPNGKSDLTGGLSASDIIKTDYDRMPADVKSKINSNKALGKYLLGGIVKGFTVEINACTNKETQEKLFAFLNNKKGFFDSEFISTGLVKLFVDPTFNSSDLKDLMDAKGIHFNFLNRFYLLKK